MLTNLAFVFICVRASSALVRTSALLQPVVRGQVYISEIWPTLDTNHVRIMKSCFSRAWCKTFVTTLFYITSYNSFALNPCFVFCNKAVLLLYIRTITINVFTLLVQLCTTYTSSLYFRSKFH